MTTVLTRRQRQLLLLALALGLALRCVIAAHSIGSNDADIWKLFAFHIRDHGLIKTYREVSFFNHPPLLGWLSWLSLELGQLLERRFIYVFKTPVLLSEAACAWLLWSVWRGQSKLKAAQVVSLFSLNFISILISAYHGNTDCLFATLCLASALAFHQQRWLLSGLALGAAINVKVVPLMLIPVLLPLLPSYRALSSFGAGLGLCALPFVVMMALAWPEFFQNVLAYNSVPFQWGIPLVIESTQSSMPALSAWLNDHYVPYARFLILALMLAIGVLQRWRRQHNVFEACALGLSAFLVLTPGFGVQYLVWPLPLLFAAHPRAAVKYSVYGGVFAFLVYYLFWTGAKPWYSDFTGPFPEPAPFFGVLAWLVLVGYCITGFRKLLANPEAVPAPQPAAPLVTAELR